MVGADVDVVVGSDDGSVVVAVVDADVDAVVGSDVGGVVVSVFGGDVVVVVGSEVGTLELLLLCSLFLPLISGAPLPVTAV